MKQILTISRIAVVIGIIGVTGFLAPTITGTAVANLPRVQEGFIRLLLLVLSLIAFIALSNFFKEEDEKKEYAKKY